MITLVSTPEYIEPDDPSIITRWLATESPNIFRLLRQDWIVNTPINSGGFLGVTCVEDYTGAVTNSVSLYNAATGAMLNGTITNIIDLGMGTKDIVTDIPYVAGMNPTYMNDNTLYAGYYFEGRLTVNGILYPLTIKASPDVYGYGDLDVSGILRIITTIGKVGDYTARIMAETNKSGKFNFEYRECWYGSSNDWEAMAVTSPVASPPILEDWYYAECVRSEEQGSNIHEYVANDCNEAPFLNQFTEPVYFLGLPFDLSFIMPERILVTPTADITVTINIYDSNNLLLSTIVENVDADSLEGFINSLTIDPTTIPENASYMTAEITSL